MTDSLDTKSRPLTPTLNLARDDATIRELTIHRDPRGSVRETLRASWFRDLPPIVQLVQSESEAGVLRAMHAHKTQFDVWHFTAGTALVQVYDHRYPSEMRAFWANSGQTIIIPPGLSHGFYTPTGCTLIYGLTREYDGADEFEWDAYDDEFPGSMLWPFRWSVNRSDRDTKAPSLAQFKASW